MRTSILVPASGQRKKWGGGRLEGGRTGSGGGAMYGKKERSPRSVSAGGRRAKAQTVVKQVSASEQLSNTIIVLPQLNLN